MSEVPNIAIRRVQTPSSAINKSFFVQLGWRPTMILIYGMDSGGRNGIVVDGQTDSGEVGLLPTNNNAWDHDAADGITIEDKGFTIGTSTTIFRRNDAQLTFVAIGLAPGDRENTGVVTLDNDLPLRDDEAFGEGDQYDADIETDGSGRYNPEFSDPGVYRES